jgi:heme exporter protein D
MMFWRFSFIPYLKYISLFIFCQWGFFIDQVIVSSRRNNLNLFLASMFITSWLPLYFILYCLMFRRINIWNDFFSINNRHFSIWLGFSNFIGYILNHFFNVLWIWQKCYSSKSRICKIGFLIYIFTSKNLFINFLSMHTWSKFFILLHTLFYIWLTGVSSM